MMLRHALDFIIFCRYVPAFISEFRQIVQSIKQVLLPVRITETLALLIIFNCSLDTICFVCNRQRVRCDFVLPMNSPPTKILTTVKVLSSIIEKINPMVKNINVS